MTAVSPHNLARPPPKFQPHNLQPSPAVRKKGVLAQKEESGNHQNNRFVTVATIHSYKKGSLAEPESRTRNTITQLQPFQFYRIQSAVLPTGCDYGCNSAFEREWGLGLAWWVIVQIDILIFKFFNRSKGDSMYSTDLGIHYWTR